MKILKKEKSGIRTQIYFYLFASLRNKINITFGTT